MRDLMDADSMFFIGVSKVYWVRQYFFVDETIGIFTEGNDIFHYYHVLCSLSNPNNAFNAQKTVTGLLLYFPPDDNQCYGQLLAEPNASQHEDKEMNDLYMCS